MRMPILMAVLAALCAVPAGAQEEGDKEKESKGGPYAENRKFGVSIMIPQQLPKDKREHWRAKPGGAFYKNSLVMVEHKIDQFSIDVMVQEKDNPMGRWADLKEIAENSRKNFTEEREGQPSNWTDCKLIEEVPRSKDLAKLSTAHMQHIVLTGRNDNKVHLWEYYCISSDDLVIVTLKSTEESYKKYYPNEGRQILRSIDRIKKDKKK